MGTSLLDCRNYNTKDYRALYNLWQYPVTALKQCGKQTVTSSGQGSIQTSEDTQWRLSPKRPSLIWPRPHLLELLKQKACLSGFFFRIPVNVYMTWYFGWYKHFLWKPFFEIRGKSNNFLINLIEWIQMNEWVKYALIINLLLIKTYLSVHQKGICFVLVLITQR